jgi:hypothetical protein
VLSKPITAGLALQPDVHIVASSKSRVHLLVNLGHAGVKARSSLYLGPAAAAATVKESVKVNCM